MGRKIAWYPFLFFMVMAASCQSFLSYTGALVPSQHRIDLTEKDAQKRLWKTEDLSVHYGYARDSNQLQLTGFIEFDDSLTYNFSSLENFSLEVYFVSSEGKVIGSSVIVFSGYNNEIDTIPFRHTFELPPGTHAIAFSYSGTARNAGEAGRDGESGSSGDYWRFWLTPFE